MDHAQREGGKGLNNEVAVTHAIERVCRHAVEAQLRCGPFAIQRIARPGERARPKRADIRPAPAVGHPPAVALEHFDIGK